VEGYHGDAAFTMGIGQVSPLAQRLMDTTEASLWAGIEAMEAGHRLNDIGRAVSTVAAKAGFSVVREYTGHGIGTAMHEDPNVPNYYPGHPGPVLKPGMPLAVEPMLNAGRADTRTLSDGWSVVTADGSLSAHFEHTIVVTDNGPEVLTVP
jgi:methionyl aminopeptidase